MTSVLRQRRETERKGEVRLKTEAEIGVPQPQPRSAWSHQKLEEIRKNSPLKPSHKAHLC